MKYFSKSFSLVRPLLAAKLCLKPQRKPVVFKDLYAFDGKPGYFLDSSGNRYTITSIRCGEGKIARTTIGSGKTKQTSSPFKSTTTVEYDLAANTVKISSKSGIDGEDFDWLEPGIKVETEDRTFKKNYLETHRFFTRESCQYFAHRFLDKRIGGSKCVLTSYRGKFYKEMIDENTSLFKSIQEN